MLLRLYEEKKIIGEKNNYNLVYIVLFIGL